MNFFKTITDKVATKKGAWIIIVVWLVIMIGLSAGPRLGDYKVTDFQSLPDEAQSIIAQNQLDEYFPNDQMLTLFNGEHTYHGVKSFKRSFFMVSHFANDIENTVGTNVSIEDEQWALFLRSNNTSFFTEFHIIILGFIVVVLICSIVGILLLSRKLIHSLSELTSTTKEIAIITLIIQ